MASTTNYNWDTPDNSGLVKNGAQDMRTLGNAIDTSVWNVGFGQAGKNKIINGDFNIWQRGTTGSSVSASGNYVADRWLFSRNGTDGTGTNTISRETFPVGQTDVPNNPTFFSRWTTTTLATSQTRIDVNQYIENVSTFAGQTATLSFYIKSSGTFAISTFVEQNFGSGGSTTVTTTAGTGNTSTSWQRFTTTVAIPSITGKTVGTSNFLRILIRVSSPTAGATFDFANVQLEYGSRATPFQTASGGSPQAELAMCQRYYYRSTPSVTFGRHAIGNAYNTTTGLFQIPLPSQMRVAPTAVDSGNIVVTRLGVGSYASPTVTLDATTTGVNCAVVQVTTSGTYAIEVPLYIQNNNNTAGFIGFSAEL